MRMSKKDLAFSIMFFTILGIWLVSGFFITIYPYKGLVKVYGVAFAETVRYTFALLWVALFLAGSAWGEK